MFRKILISTVALVAVTGTAFAADLPSRSAPPVYVPPPPPPIFSWTGAYVGGQIGYEWGTSSSNLFPTAFGPGAGASLGSYSPNGVVGGAHIGYNYQISQFVVGLEGDVNGSDYHGSTSFGGLATQSTRTDVDGSIRGRVGVAWDRALIYATGGAAFGPIRNSFTSFGGINDSSSTTRVGWTVGGGVEYAVPVNLNLLGHQSAVTLRAEYLHYDLGRKLVNVGAVGGGVSGGYVSSFKTAGDELRTAVNFKF